jgi:hypothetical protein
VRGFDRGDFKVVREIETEENPPRKQILISIPVEISLRKPRRMGCRGNNRFFAFSRAIPRTREPPRAPHLSPVRAMSFTVAANACHGQSYRQAARLRDAR